MACRDRKGCCKKKSNKNCKHSEPNEVAIKVRFAPGKVKGKKRAYKKKKRRTTKVVITEHANKRLISRLKGKVRHGELIFIAKKVKKNCQKEEVRIQGLRTKSGKKITLVLKDEYNPKRRTITRTIITVF